MQGNRQTIPAALAEDVPAGLCWYELREHLKCNLEQAKLWTFHTGYQVVDGRKKHNKYNLQKQWVKGRKHSDEEYRSVLEAGAQTRTLEEVATDLGITRERVRQLYNKFGISRTNRNDGRRGKEAVELALRLAPHYKNQSELASAVGVSDTVLRLARKQHGVRFMFEGEALRQMGQKRCTKCGEAKYEADFYSRYAQCKACIQPRQRAYYARKRQKERLKTHEQH